MDIVCCIGGACFPLRYSKRNVVVTSQWIWHLPLSSSFVNSVFDILHSSTNKDCLPYLCIRYQDPRPCIHFIQASNSFWRDSVLSLLNRGLQSIQNSYCRKKHTSRATCPRQEKLYLYLIKKRYADRYARDAVTPSTLPTYQSQATACFRLGFRQSTCPYLQ